MSTTNTVDASVAVGERLGRLAEVARELGDQDLAAEASAEQRRLVEARFFVACVGQFKRGKSTLLNALVGESVLPVGVIPVTSVITILSYADTPGAVVRFSNGQSEAVDPDAIANFVDERRNPDNQRGATVVEVGLPSALLRDGLCLVDTPGLGSVHATNTEATRAFVPRIDVALIVVGPDPPISGTELEMIQEADREAGELTIILNKADQASPGDLREILEFTRTTISPALRRPLEHMFTISALERLTSGEPTREWSALESYLRRLSTLARERLVARATDRAVKRIARRIVGQLAQRQDALRRPIVEIEERAEGLRQALADVDRDLAELRFRFDAAEADLGAQFERQRTHFIERTTSLTQTLLAWVEANASTGPSLRGQAFEEARRLATDAIQEWFDAVEPEATRLYRATTERFIDAANESIRRVAAAAADLEADQMPADGGFRLRRQFYFTHLMHTTAGTPVSWIVDRLAPSSMRQAYVARATAAYLAHLLESNSHRVENDFRDRTRESRRWLERQIRTRLARTLQAAERALTVARDKRQMSEADVSAELHRLQGIQVEIAALL
ncbi:MAG TPA: dynamin family protein [Vicinamibacterales bacterium]|jgi:GTP-binding protein EngB required for normal cell division